MTRDATGPPPRASITAGTLTLPDAADRVLGRPAALHIQTTSDGYLTAPARSLTATIAAHRAALRGPSANLTLVNTARAILGGVRLYLGRRNQRCHRRTTTATYAVPGLAPGEYGIANYEHTLMLVPADHEEHASRQHAWQSASGYHEHLALEDQDTNAHDVSRWLATDVLTPKGNSFLELGCGAGRNLHWLHHTNPAAALAGIDINPQAITAASQRLSDADLSAGSIYELQHLPANSVDVVYTSGVLMHIPHDRVNDVIQDMHRIARRAVVHFELHGPSHSFDFHRYPRDYDALYRDQSLAANWTYDVYDATDFRSKGTDSFRHALLCATPAALRVQTEPSDAGGR